MSKSTLSVIIITQNEGHQIQRCLDSVAWADEIIVVDSHSTDNTIALCKKAKVKVYTHDWLGYGPQKNLALSYATADWILSIDADEVVTPQLKQVIQTTLQQPQHAIYQLKRNSFFLGKLIQHGDWHNDQVTRLFQRGKAKFSPDQLHEKLVYSGTAKCLSQPLLHYSYQTVDDILTKLHRYAIAGATQRFQEGQPASFAKAIIKALWCFNRGYLFRMGFLDGKYGWMLALYNMQYTYYRYLALWKMKPKSPRDRSR